MPVIAPTPQDTTAPPGSGPRLVATPEPGGQVPRIRLDVGDIARTGPVSVTRVLPSGQTAPVRGGLTVLSGGTGHTWDYEPPHGVPVSYRVASLGLASGRVTLDYDRPSLMDPFRPATFWRLEPHHLQAAALADREWASQASRLRPLNRAGSIHVSTGSRAPAADQLLLWTVGTAEHRHLLDLLRNDSPLLLNVPPSLGWDVETEYISPGTLTRSRGARPLAGAGRRGWSLPYEVTDRPVGDFRALWTLAEIAQDFDTLGDLAATYTSLRALAEDDRTL